ncbi:MAG: signal recognition particle protein [Bacilli bacterium]|nr:signal recognition particle protein [Bacilli bacterium]
MAFEMLQDKLQGVFKKLRGQGRLTEKNMDEMLREVKIALIDADVNHEVVRTFISELKEKMIGTKVLNQLDPSQMVVKLVNEAMIELLGGEQYGISFASNKPTIIMMVGLQGGGKTTTSAKLANLLKTKNNRRVMMVALDVYRPGAITQLEQLGNKLDVFVYKDEVSKDVVKIAKDALAYAKYNNYDTLIFDTAGRLAIDEVLMDELHRLDNEFKPVEKLLVVDAMSGQDVVNVAKTFNDLLHLTGAVMTKLDGDARGGAALSIAKLTGVHIKFVGMGEKVSDLQAFNPKRMSERILGMGDILELVEKAQENIDEKKATKLMNRMLSGKFDLEDMLFQFESANKMGPLGGLAKLMPGMPKISEEDALKAEKKMAKSKAVIYSMTKEERKNPDILKASRKQRIAKGCGLDVSDVNNVLKQYEQTKLAMKQMSQMMRGGRFPKF